MKVLGSLLCLLFVLAGIQPAHAERWAINVTSPVNYQTYQRDGENRGAIRISGWYLGNPRAIQARWRYGPWVTIDTTLARGKGKFSGALVNQSAGQGTLQVRIAGSSLVDTVWLVGIGDIFVMAGQSNMQGRGMTTHQYTRTNIRATMLGNDDRWGELVDPYDSNKNQVDQISRDPVNQGSFVAEIANKHIRRTGVPLAIIPAAQGGSSIYRWKRSTSRYTMYGSMLRRVGRTGGKVKAVLWFQGESDAHTSIDSYQTSLSTFADAVNRDFRGAKVVPAIIGSAYLAGEQRAGVRIGTLEAIRNNSNLVMGPSLYDVNIDDERGDKQHFRSSRDLAIAGWRFWVAIDDAFYGGPRGHGPELEEATLAGDVLRLEFDTDLDKVTATDRTFWVRVDGTRVSVRGVVVDDDAVLLTLAQIPDGEVTVSYGHDNRSAIDRAIYNSRGLPAIPFHEVDVETD